MSKAFAEAIQRAIRKGHKSEEKVHPARPTQKWRPSSLGRICPREEVLATRHKFVRTKKISTWSNWTLSFGHAVHHLIQDVRLAEVLRGHWRCVGCGTVHTGPNKSWILRPKRCMETRLRREDDLIRVRLAENVTPRARIPKPISKRPLGQGRRYSHSFISCGSKQFRFEEVTVKTDLTSGHPDGAVMVRDLLAFLARMGLPFANLSKLDQDQLGITEIKSMAPEFYDCVGHPETHESWLKLAPESAAVLREFLRVYKIQAQHYMKASGIYLHFTILINKLVAGPDDSIKVYCTEFDPEIYNASTAPIKAYRKSIADGSLPEGVCNSRHCERATKCQLVDLCFAAVPERELAPADGAGPQRVWDRLGDFLGTAIPSDGGIGGQGWKLPANVSNAGRAD